MNSNKKNWWIDAVLFGSFLLTFLMELTGLELHQWIGIIAGLIVVFHLIIHGKWIFCVLENFLGKSSWRARFFFLIDLVLVVGFAVIIFTGLIMSTWLSLSLDDYDTWRIIHYWASIVSLQVVLLKIALHWNWIVNVAKTRLFPASQKELSPALKIDNKVDPSTSRRQFLKIGAAVGAVAVVEGVQLAKAYQAILDMQAAARTTDIPEANDDFLEPQSEYSQLNEATVAPQLETIPTATPQPSSPIENPLDSCVVRCPRGCAFPGRCRRYTDSNNNGFCDLGECL